MAVKKPAPEVEPAAAPLEPEIQPSGAGTFAERRAARLKAIQSSENKAVQRSETK